MLKKIVNVLIVITLLTGICSNVFASELKTTLEIVKKSSKTEYLENDQGYLSKEIIDSDLDAGEVTIKTTLINQKEEVAEEETTVYDNTEIFIIVSENIANDEEELNTYITNIENLSNKVFNKSSNVKIGIVGITGTIDGGKLDENGNMVWGENDTGHLEGTADNAEIVINPTNNVEEIKTSLLKMNSSKTEYHTNLQAAIRLANDSFSKNANKILICLYDRVPGIAIGVKSQGTYGGGITIEEAVRNKTETIANKTYSEILTLKSNNVDFIVLRPDNTSYDGKFYSTSTGELLLEFDGSPYVEKIYGTMENPTYGKMYSLNDSSLETIVEDYIYKDVIETMTIDIKSAEIKEYFSEEILDNFDITFSDKDIDTSNLKEDGYIVWNIGDVQGNKSASLEYTLKI